jgi:ABC-2 type transport system permease protein
VVSFANLATGMVWQIPMALVATLVFGLTWPADPRVWGVFLVSAFLGRTVLFFFDWLLACLTFYLTEVWGLSVLVLGVSMFMSGALVPVVMMPVWLQSIVRLLPFAQALYVPLSLLSGIAPVSSAPHLWLVQLAWVIGLGITSRLVFRVAVRKVTVQGG